MLHIVPFLLMDKAFSTDFDDDYKAETELSDNFFTYNNVSPACVGESYYKIVEISPSNEIKREIVRYNAKFAYYVPNYRTYLNWYSNFKKTEKIVKTEFKELLFVSPSGTKIDSLYNGSSLKEGVRDYSLSSITSDPNYRHKSPVASSSIADASLSGIPISAKSYMISVLDDKNGIWVICISGCSYSRYPMSSRIVECIEKTIEMLIST